MDFKKLASNLGLDEEDFNELLEIFTDTSFTDIQKIELGLKENNADPVAQAAHSIKGASANLGFQEIASIAQDIEMTAKADNLQGVKEKIDDITKQLETIENTIKTT